MRRHPSIHGIIKLVRLNLKWSINTHKWEIYQGGNTMINATLVKEISVETPNTIGTAAKLTHTVSGLAKANILSAWAAGDSSKGHFSLITDNNQKAMEALKKEFPKTAEHEVVVLTVPNAVGTMEEVSEKISKAGLNIEYLYTTYIENKPSIVLSTNDNKKALSLFTH